MAVTVLVVLVALEVLPVLVPLVEDVAVLVDVLVAVLVLVSDVARPQILLKLQLSSVSSSGSVHTCSPSGQTTCGTRHAWQIIAQQIAFSDKLQLCQANKLRRTVTMPENAANSACYVVITNTTAAQLPIHGCLCQAEQCCMVRSKSCIINRLTVTRLRFTSWLGGTAESSTV